MEDIVYIELNNWMEGWDYPLDEGLYPLIDIYSDEVERPPFCDDAWCKEHKICVLCGPIDMSINWCITAPISFWKEWCPNLLTDKEFQVKENAEVFNYSSYRRLPREDGSILGQWEWKFLPYKEENYGVHWVN